MRLITVFIFFALITVSPYVSGTGEAKSCSKQEAIQAETEASTLQNWDSVYTSFQRFNHCDDGAIAEGYSEDVGRLLATQWDHFERLYELTRNDKEFQNFIIRHIDETVPQEYSIHFIENARLRCPSDAESLCRTIIDRDRELEELIKKETP